MLRSALRRRAVAAGAAAVTVGGVMMYSQSPVHAEAPPASLQQRKPIYDFDNDNDNENNNNNNNESSQQSASPASSSSSSTALNPPPAISKDPTPSSTAPTEQLASQVRHARLFLYKHSLTAENAFNDAVSRVLHVETRFTSTLASLAPPSESNERLLPGSIYVLVTAMAGSIVARNRGIILRTATPLALGTAAAYRLLPITMRNVGDLVWEYERRVPALADGHVRVRAAAEESWSQAVAHSHASRVWMEGKIGEGRRSLEQWISKGP